MAQSGRGVPPPKRGGRYPPPDPFSSGGGFFVKPFSQGTVRNPIAASIAAGRDDLENAGALAAPGRIFGRCAELVEEDLDNALELALLGGWTMTDVGCIAGIFSIWPRWP